MILTKNHNEILSKSKWSCFINAQGKLAFFIYFMEEMPKLNFHEILKLFSLKLSKKNDHVFIKNGNQNLGINNFPHAFFACKLDNASYLEIFNNLQSILNEDSKTPSFLLFCSLITNWQNYILEKINEQNFVLTSAEELTFGLDIAFRMRFYQTDPQKGAHQWKTYYEAMKRKETLILAAAEKKISPLNNFCPVHIPFEVNHRLDLIDISNTFLIPNTSFSVLNNFAHNFVRDMLQSELVIILYESFPYFVDYEQNKNFCCPDMAVFNDTCNWSLAACFMLEILIDVCKNIKYEFQHKLTDILNFWKKRTETDSIVTLLKLSSLQRTHDPKVFFLTKYLDSNSICLMPSIPNPVLFAKSEKEMAKLNLKANDQFFTLQNLSRIDKENPTQIIMENIPFVNQKAHLVADYIQICLSKPDCFSNISFLENGYLSLSNDEFDDFKINFESRSFEDDTNHKAATKPDFKYAETYIKNESILQRMSGCVPWRLTEVKQISTNRQIERYQCAYALGYTYKELQETKDISFGFRFQAANESSINLSINEALIALKTLQNEFFKLKDTNSLSLEKFNEKIEILNENLKFIPVAYFEIDGQEVTEDDWLKAKKTNQGYKLPSGISLSVQDYEKYLEVYYLRKKVFARFKYLTLQDIWKSNFIGLSNVENLLSPEEYLSQLGLRTDGILKAIETNISTQLADYLNKYALKHLKAELRPYQHYGVAWAYIRLKLNLGICIADEMGLGKTLQAIALMKLIKSKNEQNLVVVPKTLLINWKRELEKFDPQTTVQIFTGEEEISNADVILVTYPRLRIQESQFSKIQWNAVFLDEAHAIKNSETQTAQTVKNLKTKYRVALTGTPIENHAKELWSLIDFLNPGYLGKSQDFTAFTTYARSSEQKAKLLEPIKSVLSPIILRRMKSDPEVELNLPDKIFENMECELSDEQNILYRAILEVVGSELLEIRSNFQRQCVYLKALLHLKQICNHPEAFYKGSEDDDVLKETNKNEITYIDSKVKKIIEKKLLQKYKPESKNLEQLLGRSGKLQALYDLLLDLKDSGDGIIIFTQFRAMAAIILKMLQWSEVKNWQKTEFIDGSLTAAKRMEIVDDFQKRCEQNLSKHHNKEEGCPLLLLSLKAGGVGLNLMKANRVIHFDRWWNPAVEAQATDRVHRFGQSRTVFVHHFTSYGTIEESIARLHETKKLLAQDLLGGAEAETTAEILADESGFWNLVDPLGHFSKGYSKIVPNNIVNKKLSNEKVELLQ